LGERIKQLRKALGLTQKEFGERIGVKPNTIGTYEIGRNEPIDAVASLICREFGVNENWFYTGVGEMFIQLSRSQEVTEFVGKILKGDNDNFKRRFVAVLAQLDEPEWQLIEKMVQKLSNGETKEGWS